MLERYKLKTMPDKNKKETKTENRTENRRKTVLLIDSHALLHRAYHAMVGFATHDGRPTGALFGFIKMIMRAADNVHPEHIVACYDLPKPTFRHLAYDAYKGTRGKSDDDLKVQINQSKDFCVALGIPVCELEGFEADDLLGTLSERLVDTYDVVIVSGDMDTMQLIKSGVRVCTLKKGNDIAMFNEKEVVEKFGILPTQIADYKGLAGDSSDNIVGVKGVGEKTAVKLITSFQSIENLYENIKNAPEKVKEVVSERIFNILKDSEDEAIFSKTLATIRLDAPMQVDLGCRWPDCVNIDEYKKLCDSYDLRTLRSLFDKDMDQDKKSQKAKESDMDDFEATLNGKERNGNVDSRNLDKIENQNMRAVLNTHQLIQLQNMCILLNSEKLKPGLDEIVTEYLIDTESSKTFEGLEAFLIKELKSKNLYEYYENIDKKIEPIIDHMELAGILVDQKVLAEQNAYLKDVVEKLEKEIHTLCGREFLISSPKQLGEVLYDDLGLGTKIKKTATGKRSTNVDQLNKMKDEHPVIEKILYWREVSKLYGTYIDPMPRYIHDDGRLHPHFVQAGSATGRFSCENPNMQNLPTKTDLGHAVKKIFVASEGYVLMSLDYSQIDLRAAAILSADKKLLEIFENNIDVHTGVAAQVLHKSESEVTTEERRKAKAINFGILYGMGVSALKEAMNAERAEAQVFYDTYKETFSELMTYLENVKSSAIKTGRTYTLLGRPRYIPMIQSHIPFIRAQGERMAINAPIQGTSADIIKLGMIDVYNDTELQSYFNDGSLKMQLQIHDELVFEVKTGIVEKVGARISYILTQVLEKRKAGITQKLVPLNVSLGTGKNMAEVK